MMSPLFHCGSRGGFLTLPRIDLLIAVQEGFMAQPTAQEALVYIMVIVSASDRNMRDEELARIGAIIRTLPAFADFPQSRTLEAAQDCQKLLHEEAGLEGVLAMISNALSPEMRETAYALAVDVASADHSVALEELRILDILRSKLAIDDAAVGAIDRAASIRHRAFTQ